MNRRPLTSRSKLEIEFGPLYAAGLRDVDIAKRLDTSIQRVHQIRTRRGLSANGPDDVRCFERMNLALRLRISALNLSGMSDRDIAPLVGVARDRVRAMRAEMGLYPHGYRRRNNRKILSDEDLVRNARAGMSWAEIARRFGVHRSTVSNRAARAGIPSTRRIDRQRVRELFERGLHDEEMAEELGCAEGTVVHVRLELGLRRAPSCGGRPRGSEAKATRSSRRSRATFEWTEARLALLDRAAKQVARRYEAWRFELDEIKGWGAVSVEELDPDAEDGLVLVHLRGRMIDQARAEVAVRSRSLPPEVVGEF